MMWMTLLVYDYIIPGEIKLYEKNEKKKTHEDYHKNSFI